MSDKKIRVLIADDHPIVRQGLETLINSQPDLFLIGQAADGNEVVLLMRELNPDLIVMDLKMPVKNGLTALEEIKASNIDLPVLVLTSYPDEEMVIAAIHSGADGVMLKDSPPEQLLGAIRDVVQGKSVLHSSVAHKVMMKVKQSTAETPQLSTLTNREKEVLKCLAQGLTNKEIAMRLSISSRTVSTHVRNILNKLGLENRTQSALYAVEHGIVEKKN